MQCDSTYEARFCIELFKGNSKRLSFPVQSVSFSQQDYNRCLTETSRSIEEATITFESEMELDELPVGHTQALAYVFENVGKIESSVLKGVLALLNNYIEGYVNAVEEGGKALMTQCLNELCLPENLVKTFALDGVQLLKENEEGVSYYVLNFNCEWDREHGFSMMMKKDELIKIGEGGAFPSSGI